jgi:hypothetical protein
MIGPSLPDTDVVLVDGVVLDLPHSDADRSFGQADLIDDPTRKVVTPGLICDSPSSTRPLTRRSLWVQNWSFTSGDLGIFVYQPTE